MSQALVVFASSHGHTAQIAGRIAAELERAQVHVDVVDAGDKDAARSIDAYDLVVVGASIHAGKHEREIIRWVKERCEALGAVPSGFFSVSMAAIGEDASSQAEVARYVDDFQDLTHWRPGRVATFAGALQYREYNWLLRRVIRRIARGKGIATDTSRDHDYTDWDAVAQFARELVVDVRTAENHGAGVRPAPDGAARPGA